MTVYPVRSVCLDTLNGEKGYRMAFLRACEQRLASMYDVGKIEMIGRILMEHVMEAVSPSNG